MTRDPEVLRICRTIEKVASSSAAYIGAWVKKLRDDKFEVFRAAKDARKMVDFLAGRLVLEPVDAPSALVMPQPAMTM